MAERQTTTPLIVRGDSASVLQRVPFDEQFKSESWLQELLFKHPRLLPIGEIDRAFEDAVPLAREVRTACGPLDLLYINDKGYLTLAETKLWRNPEARREVVGQVIDYAKEMARWSWPDLVDAVRRAGGGAGGDPVLDAVRRDGETLDAARFIDSVSRNLERGNFLLLIVGDGIQESVEHMSDFLQRTPQLGFTLGLIEIGLYRLDSSDSPAVDDTLIVQPRIVARTREVTRAIIEFRGVSPSDVKVTLPEEVGQRGGATKPRPRRSVDESSFFEELAESAGAAGPQVVALAKQMLAEADQHQLTVDWGDAGPLLKYVDDETGDFFTLGALTRYAELGSTGRLAPRFHQLGLPHAIWQDYLDQVAALAPDVARKTFQTRDGWECGALASNGKWSVPLEPFLRNKEKWYAAIDRAVDRIREALRGK